MSGTLLAGRTTHGKGTPGAGQQRSSHGRQTPGTHGAAHQSGASHSRALSQYGLTGSDCSGRHQAPTFTFYLGNSEGKTLCVWSVELEVFLAAEVSSTTPSALNSGNIST